MSGTLPWYIARAAGLVAWALLAAATLWGLALSTKVARRRSAPRPNWLLDMHRWLGGTALALHGRARDRAARRPVHPLRA